MEGLADELWKNLEDQMKKIICEAYGPSYVLRFSEGKPGSEVTQNRSNL